MDATQYNHARQQHLDLALRNLADLVAEMGAPDQQERATRIIESMDAMNADLILDGQ